MKKSSTKILTLPLRFALITLIFGALFKIMHWPYSNLLMSIGSCAILILYTIRFIYKKEKVRIDYIKLGLVVLWVISYVNQALHLFNLSYYFEIVLMILFIWWLIEEGLSYFGNRILKENKTTKFLYYALIIITICCLGFGTLFKIQHWPYGALLFTLGILFLCLTLIVDYVVVTRT
ncbi:GldL-related protein [Psychroserpens sp.]|uniref:GldL-related protein n=1 Tax=Psychroserpens sp. TaxID=2020870 RepID=UPI002B278FD8|nr:hypothetical protein [Psychroserpens sp.]